MVVFVILCIPFCIRKRKNSFISQYLTFEATKTLVCAHVLFWWFYCNSLLSDCPLYLLSRIQKVQNSVAKLVFKARGRDRVQPLLQALHWLPVQTRIDYKLSTDCRVSQLLSDSSPACFSDLLTIYTPSLQLRSSADAQTLVSSTVEQKP